MMKDGQNHYSLRNYTISELATATVWAAGKVDNTLGSNHQLDELRDLWAHIDLIAKWNNVAPGSMRANREMALVIDILEQHPHISTDSVEKLKKLSAYPLNNRFSPKR
jgi:hypothetical protein